MKKFVTLILAAVYGVAAMQAADNYGAFPFTRIQRDPVRAALGGSGYAVRSSIAYSSWANAAAIPFASEKLEAAAGYQFWEPDFSMTHAISAGIGWNILKTVGLSIGTTYGLCPSYPITEDDSSTDRIFRPAELQLNLGASWRFIDCLSIGANVHYASQTLMPSYRLYSIYSDIFLMAMISDFTITAGVSSLGSPLQLAGDREYAREHKFYLPTSVSAGFAWHRVFHKTHGVDVNVDFDYYLSREAAAGLGVAYTYRGIFSLRLGGHCGKSIPPYISAGAGVKLFGGLNLDLYYLGAGKNSILRNTFGAGLRYTVRRYPSRR